jgi:predicted cytidylate kinase
MIITISGSAGSGKSTVGKFIAKKLGLKHYSTGDFMREIAKERNISLEELGEIAEEDRSIDVALDKRQITLGKKEDNFVIDGRLSFHFIPKAVKIFLDADLKIRAQRIWKDIKDKGLRKDEQAGSVNEVMEKIKIRNESEKKRYQKYYKLNPHNKKHYDLVVDTSKITAEEAADKIVRFIRNKQ